METLDRISPYSYKEFKHIIKWLYAGRIITAAPCFIVYIISASLGKFLPDIRWIIAIIIFETLVNAPYDFLLKKFYNAKKENLLIIIMLSLDVIAVTLAMHFIGLQDGLFYGAMYLITITFAGILTTTTITYFITSLASVCYGGLTVLEYNGIIQHIPTIGIQLTAAQSAAWAVSHIMFFYITAYLSNFFSSPIKLREKELYLWNKKLKSRLNKSHAEAIRALLNAIKAKDPYTETHSFNVAWYSAYVAKTMNLPEETIMDIKDACFLHDVGKIGIQDSILNKKTKLTKEEFEKMKHHTEVGAEIITSLSGMENVSKMVLQEHEQYDGTGYPNGLKGDEILPGTHIVAVADAFDVMVTGRPYSKKIHPDTAAENIKSKSGTQFNPKIVESFCKTYKENRQDFLSFIK